MQQTIKVGVHDWSRFANDQSFYPEDLPEEWRLSYFANEFASACLRLTDTEDAEHLHELCEDLPQAFEVSFVIHNSSQLATVIELVAEHGFTLGSLLLEATESDILLQIEQRKSLLWGADYTGKGRYHQADAIWTPQHAHRISDLALLPQQSDMRQYRFWIEQWLQQNVQPESGELELWLEGAEASYKTLHELRTLVEIMGY